MGKEKGKGVYRRVGEGEVIGIGVGYDGWVILGYDVYRSIWRILDLL